MLGEKLKTLREGKGLVQREIAAFLEVDTAYISKVENNEKPLSRNHLSRLAEILTVPEVDLFTIWLADKVYDLLKDEAVGLRAIQIAEVELKAKK